MNDAPVATELPQDELERRHWLTLILTSVGVLMVVMDATIVNVALPIIREDLGFLEVSLTELQWVVNAYALSFAVLLLLSGKLADLYGRKRLFVIGLILFTGASIACGASNEINVLIAVRALQGIGAALIMPTTLSILQASFPLSKLGMAIGIWSAIVGLGTAIGPLAGGVLAEEVDWRWVFYINAPLGLGVLFGTLVSIRESKAETVERRLDYVGALLSAVGLFLVTFGLLKVGEFGWGDARTIGSLVGGLLGMCAFVIYERSHPAPMVDLTLFRSSVFSGANLVAVFAGFALFGLLFFGSLFIQSIMGFSATETGLSQLPMMAMIMVFGPIVGKLIGKIGTGPILTVGMVLLSVSFLLFSLLDFDSNFWNLLAPMIVGGVGFAWVLTPLTAAALSAVPVAQAGVGAALINSTRQVGGSLGLALLGVISTEFTAKVILEGDAPPEGFADSFAVLMYAGAAVALVGALTAYLMIVRPAQAAARAAAAAAPEPAPEEVPAPAAAPQQVEVQYSRNWAVAAPSVVSALPASLAERAGATRRAARVEVVDGPAAGATLTVGDRPLVLGRGEKGAGTLGDDSELSRRHARLSRSDGRMLIEDLGSTNGTLVNGKEISGPTAVGPDDSIEVGTSKLRVLAPDPGEAPAGDVPAIEVLDGPAAGTRIGLGPEPLVFGRSESGPGVLGNDPELSRRHASASVLDGTRVLLEDLGSTNGTFVNDHRIGNPTVIGPGDRVRVGGTVLAVKGARAEAAATR